MMLGDGGKISDHGQEEKVWLGALYRQLHFDVVDSTQSKSG